jgi:sigma-B regulation protein RsbU (phosphoserine phosphatase)
MTSSVTSDFREEYEAERGRFLRKRFLWYSGVVIGLAAISLVAQFVALTISEEARQAARQLWLQGALGLISTLLYLIAFAWAWRHTLDRDRMLKLLYVLIVASGALSILGTPLIFEASRSEIRRQIVQSLADGKPVVTEMPGVKLTFDPKEDAERSLAPGGAEPSAAHAGAASEPFTDEEIDDRVSRQIARMVALGNALGSIFFTHFFACLFLPWTARESIKPMVPLLVLNAVVSLFYIRWVPTWGPIILILSPLVAVPGALVCLWRHSRFRDSFHFKMLKGRYGEIKQELGFARQIHESMFPPPVREGPVCFDYRYEPMRQIGGDYLFARFTPPSNGALPVLTLAIIDVTGHGIGAALTVNRLHGEIEREFGENAAVTPGELLTGLNDYLHHTLATHSVYATALFMRIDPNTGRLAWASAGHPPAFLRTIDGRIERLESTTLVLGACRGDDFAPNEQSCKFLPGDVILAYTDGAIEARNSAGRMFTVDGLQRALVSSTPDAEGGWAATALRAVDEHRFGPAQDDTLMVEIFRPVKLRPA